MHRTPPSAFAIELSKNALEPGPAFERLVELRKLPQTCKMLRETGLGSISDWNRPLHRLEESAIVTLRLCTQLVHIGVVEHGYAISELAVMGLAFET